MSTVTRFLAAKWIHGFTAEQHAVEPMPDSFPYFPSLQVLVEKLGVMDAATSKAFAAKRATCPEDYPEPVSRAYAARWVACLYQKRGGGYMLTVGGGRRGTC